MNLNIKEFLDNCRRVLTISKKPATDEYMRTLRVAAIGVGLIGAIGFIFFALSVLLIPS